MNEYRPLTDDEIITLEDNGCTAEDWTGISVDEDFRPAHIHNVRFFGAVNLGVFEKSVEVTNGFTIHSGLRNATLRNVTVGDNCLIENIGNYINNYNIGEDCYICNVSTMETTAEATFGEGNMISVLNEAGSGNVMLFRGLNSNLAALMVKHSSDKNFADAVRTVIKDDISRRHTYTGTIGNGVRIVNTTEITNTNIGDNCEVNGACRLSECTLAAEPDDSVYIGSGVICENSVITDGSSILNSAKLFNCHVGEACQITNGFTAESCLFFANTYMANGEACAAFCGPFSASHHKSTLLIGCMTSFYNAGSATNFSNHAYKMGPIHYGTLERGSKTASGSHTLLPADIGTFSVCLGKIANHPDTRRLPFSYIIGDGRDTVIVPGRNITTVGLFRDIDKWQRRDLRMSGSKKSIINFDWLNPLTVNEIMKGLETLLTLQNCGGQDADFYEYEGCKISGKSLKRGIQLYNIAVKMFLGKVLEKHTLNTPAPAYGSGEWSDLSGLLLPVTEETRLADKLKYGMINDLGTLTETLNTYNDLYDNYLWTFAQDVMKRYLGTDSLTDDDCAKMREEGIKAHGEWIEEIRKDAEREYNMGDVTRDTLDKFLAQLQ